MGKLLYSALTSLDGYIEDDEGHFEWAAPSEEVHAFVNDLMRGAAIHLYGRRMYEAMVSWETMPTGPDQPVVSNDFASLWRAASKIVFSRTLDDVASERTLLKRTFEPDWVRSLKATAESDLLIGGPVLAGQALRAESLVDEIHLFVHPVVVGGGLRALPEGARFGLELVEERRFDPGVVGLHYRVTGPGG